MGLLLATKLKSSVRNFKIRASTFSVPTRQVTSRRGSRGQGCTDKFTTTRNVCKLWKHIKHTLLCCRHHLEKDVSLEQMRGFIPTCALMIRICPIQLGHLTIACCTLTFIPRPEWHCKEGTSIPS